MSARVWPSLAFVIAAAAALSGCADRGIVRESTLDMVRAIGARGSEPGHFVSPQGMACAPDGSLYVVDYGNARVQKFASDGALARVIGSRGDPYLTPGCCRSSEAILKAWAEKGPGYGRFAAPSACAVDASGSLWVLDQPANLLSRFDADGNFQAHFMGDFYAPSDVALDARGNLVVANAGGADLQIYDTSGNRLARHGLHGTAPGNVMDPNSCVADAEGNLYVADTGNRRVQKLSAKGRSVAIWTPVGVPKTLLRRIALHPSGDVYVTDEGANCVWVLDRKLRARARITSLVTEAGSVPLQWVFGLAVDGSGDVYLTDVREHVVYRCKPLPPADATPRR